MTGNSKSCSLSRNLQAIVVPHRNCHFTWSKMWTFQQIKLQELGSALEQSFYTKNALNRIYKKVWKEELIRSLLTNEMQKPFCFCLYLRSLRFKSKFREETFKPSFQFSQMFLKVLGRKHVCQKKCTKCSCHFGRFCTELACPCQLS